MRLLALFAVLLAFAYFSTPVMATDEFGSRFSADAPSALQDDPEAALADIMPAAGDEDKAEEGTRIENEADDEKSEEQDR